MRTVRRFFLLTVLVFTTSTTVIAQSLISVDPNTAQSGESLGVAITGQNTHFEQATEMSVWFSQGISTIYAYGYFPVDDTFMTVWFDIPGDSTTGLHDLYVENNIDGTLALYDSFTINPGSISVIPNTAQQGQHLAVLITGQDTHFSQASPTTTVIFSQGSPTQDTTWLSDTLLITELQIIPDAAIGQHDISIDNNIDGTLTLYNGFTITPYNPVITSITPSGASQGQSLSVTITGQNTTFVPGTITTASEFVQGSQTTTIAWFSQGSSRIYANDSYVHGRELLTATFDIPGDANTGKWDVYVPDMKEHTVLTLPDGFVITRPGDMTCDGAVNFKDFAVLANNWLEGTSP